MDVMTKYWLSEIRRGEQIAAEARESLRRHLAAAALWAFERATRPVEEETETQFSATEQDINL